MNESEVSKGRFQCLEGLHRPFNVPLCQVIWVCKFLLSISVEGKLKCKPSDINYLFFQSHIRDLHKKLRTYTVIEGVVSKENVDKIYPLISKLSIKQLRSRISHVLSKRESEMDKKIYSSYKNTSYYVTLTKKLGLIDDRYYLSQEAMWLANHKHSFFRLDSSEKEVILRLVMEKDGDMFIPFLISQPFALKTGDQSIYLKYLEKCCDITFFRYITKSQTSNYDKVRVSWIRQLGVITAKGNICKRYSWLKAKNAFAIHYDIERNFLKSLVKVEEKRKVLFQNLEDSYQELIKEGRHDAQFVNLYDIMSMMHCSYNSMNKLIEDYYEQKKEEKIVLFSNLVQSIDKRRRFYVKNNIPVLKIKII